MRVLVTGGRKYDNYKKVVDVLNKVFSSFPSKDDILIHGGATGADTLAHQWAENNKVVTEVYLAQWSRFGKRAGPVRNQEMLDKAQPQLVVAFPGGKGTADMVKRAREAGIEVMDVIDRC